MGLLSNCCSNDLPEEHAHIINEKPVHEFSTVPTKNDYVWKEGQSKYVDESCPEGFNAYSKYFGKMKYFATRANNQIVYQWLAHGEGTEINQEGSIKSEYKGTWFEGKRHGFGT